MPIENLLEYTVSTAFDHVAVTRNYLLKVPASNLPCTLIEPLTVSRACDIPEESLLPCRRSHGVLQSNEHFCQDAGRWIFISPRELFVRWEIEHHTELEFGSQYCMLKGILSSETSLERYFSQNLIQDSIFRLGPREYVLRLYQRPVPLVKNN